MKPHSNHPPPHHPRHDSHSKECSFFRVLNNVADGPDIDVYFDGKLVISQIAYSKITDFLKVPSGCHSVDIKDTCKQKMLIQAEINFKPCKSYTLIVHGLAKSRCHIKPLLLKDNLSQIPNGKARIRFVHAAASVPAVDIYAGDMLIFSNVSYGQTGDPPYLMVDAGTIPLLATLAGTSNRVIGPLTVPLPSGSNYTFVATGLVNDTSAPLSVLMIDDTLPCYFILY